MAGRWFRFHADAMRNPKVAGLSDKDFRLWCDLLCVAAENDGEIPALDTLKHLLKRRLDHLSTAVKRLISVGLIDPLECGYEPHGWQKRQYKSDSSTERVQKHRRSRNVSETPPDTETDTETEYPHSPPSKLKAAEYAFFGQTVRLKPSDLERWKTAFHAIPDINAQLVSLDTWLTRQPQEKRKDWFQIVSGALNKKHQAAIKSAANDEARTAEFSSPC